MNKNLLTKLKKNKKGFTLIELIVVIAILGILAAIAIPRFSGFTERAKEGNDEQYASLVANAAMVIVASGDVGYDTGATVTIPITAAGEIGTVTGVTFNATGNSYMTLAEFKAEIGDMVAVSTLESAKYRKSGMTVTTSDAGGNTVVPTVVPTPE